MPSEEDARRPWQANRAGEDAPHYRAQTVQSPAPLLAQEHSTGLLLHLQLPASEFAALWVIQRHQVSPRLAGVSAGLPGLGGRP